MTISVPHPVARPAAPSVPKAPVPVAPKGKAPTVPQVPRRMPKHTTTVHHHTVPVYVPWFSDSDASTSGVVAAVLLFLGLCLAIGAVARFRAA